MRTFSVDLGTNSLGWAIIETRDEPGKFDEGRIIASGVRIFSQSEMAGRDPQSKASLAVARREARGMRRRQGGLSARARMAADGEGYDFYPSHEALEREFDKMMRAQQRFHRDLLKDNAVDDIRDTVFNQRDLRPVPPGKCSYTPSETRLPKAHPLFQKFRVLKEVNERAIIAEDQKSIKLTPEQRDALCLALRTDLDRQGRITFAKLQKVIKRGGKEFRFNKETENRTYLQGDVVYFRMSRPECFGNRWAKLPIDRQVTVMEKVRSETDVKTLNELVVRRIPIDSFKSVADIMKIRTNAHGHSELRDRLWEATRELEAKAFAEAVQQFVQTDIKFKGVRHVRIAEVQNPIWITHGAGKHKKGYLPGGNDRFDVWELADGKWDAEVVTTFDAHRPDFVPRIRLENPNARKIMSLKKGDMVACNDPVSGARILAIVRKFDQRNKQLYLDPHNEAGNLDKREKEKILQAVAAHAESAEEIPAPTGSG